MCQPSVRSGPWLGGNCPGDAQTAGWEASESVGAVWLISRLLWPILSTLEELSGRQQTLTLVLTPLQCDKPLPVFGL